MDIDTKDTDGLRKRVGNMDQIAGIKVVQLDDGRERAGRAAMFHTGSGLNFTVLTDRCLDISSASFGGKALGWRSTTGDVAPQYYEAEGIRWLRSYFGGLLTTCGLRNVGAPEDGSELTGYGLHGRIGHTPASNVQVVQEWRGDDYVMSVTGSMRETSVFGENLLLTRTVETSLGAKYFTVTDTVKNESFSETPYMLLYHCNIGWPVVDEGSEVLLPTKNVTPRDAEAEDGKENWNQCDAPIHGYAEKCYFHDNAAASDGTVTTAIVNKDGFGAYVKYTQANLPRFTQWKQMGEQDYVVGLEPCNCGVQGRKLDEESGALLTLAPGESHTNTLEFGALTTIEEVEAVRKLFG